MMDVSVVCPVYQGERSVQELVTQTEAVLRGLVSNFEIILVDDRSPDRSWEEILKARARHPMVVGVRLSRNFGQHAAIAAGLARALGEWIVVMDCDLQDRPEEIPNLLSVARSGVDVVLARRAARKDPLWKRFSSRLFYGMLSYLTGADQDPAVANFGIYHRRVIAAVNTMPEPIRYFPTMVRWVGFVTAKLDVVHSERAHGRTSYTLARLLDLALDICLANSDKPLRMTVIAGFVVSLAGFAFAAFTFVQALRGHFHVLGYASLMVSVWVLAGLIILLVGVVGLYVGKCFEGIKNRPIFIVDEATDGTP